MPFPKPKEYTELRKLVAAQLSAELPLVLYRKPGENTVHALMQTSPELLGFPENRSGGFVFVPFPVSDSPAVFIRADRYYVSDSPDNTTYDYLPDAEPQNGGRQRHVEMLQTALASLRAGNLEKVVLGRMLTVPMEADLTDSYEMLLSKYSQAFCYLWYHPLSGTWMGASPELLLGYANGEIKTSALAGTYAAKGGAEPVWTAKEKREQQIVTDYIANRVRQSGGTPVIGKTTDFRAGNLWHLYTPIKAELSEAYAFELLSVLHPTPAVCGIPKEEALRFIEKHEGFDRQYYTGYLGEMGLEKSEAFQCYVNLRCMQIRDGKAHIYVGGGITEESRPEDEYEETRAKSRTMLAILKNSG
ncbi:chorismate-binding protein [Robiginitalea sp. IMCC43444]|uniref:chorismate-binding protein n=1 Tax=Robiginitalea sp. IMCC43444 TaxID=3459121 RepID=UPI004041E288